MNKFDEKYEIRLARYEEIPEIMNFIDTWWRKDHILARDRAFFEYEMVPEGQVNFLIAKDKETGEIHGLHGFLYASKEEGRRDAWGCIWKVIPGSMGLLGLEIVRRLESDERFHSFLTMGANPDTVPILKKVRHFEDVGKMDHFYCLADKEEYRIAVKGHPVSFKENDYQVEIVPIHDEEELKLFDFRSVKDAFPYKDAWYVSRRFLHHPIYAYQIYGLKEGDEVKALLICREQEYNGATALRIDYIGEASLFAGLSGFLKERLQRYEYIDFYCYNFDTDSVLAAGMTRVEDSDSNIIPNYFAPYVPANIDIWVGTPKGHAVFFKADGDQDRPS